MTITHYDDYGNLPSGLTNIFDNTWNSCFSSSYNISPQYAQPLTASTRTKGMITWTQVKVLGTANTFLYAVSIYDEKGRPIQVKSTNITGGTDIATTQYSWAGQPLTAVMKQEKGGAQPQTTVTVTQMSYDELGRVTQTDKKVQNTNVNGNAMPASWTTIAKNEYDALGQLKKKTLSPAYNNNAGLESLTYDYNIRGWLLGMNRDYTKDNNSSNYFGFDLGYDKINNNIIESQTYNNPQFNGNIEGTVWKSKGDGEKRKYDFNYDAVNRITGAGFNQYTGGTFNKTAGVDFTVGNLSYDANGNILTQNQMGLKLNASSPIDQLQYSYLPNSNKLKAVTDGMNDNQSKLGDFKYDAGTKTVTDYTYDVNGNMISDANKKITAIAYNYLNLPQTITITGKGSIDYVYDAAGSKLKKTVHETGKPDKTTLYLAGAVYENDVLQLVNHEEGRVRYTATVGTIPAKLSYDYFLKDHLGNIRMVLTEEQQQDAYPAASMETAQATTEESFYKNVNTTRAPKPAGYPNDGYTNPNDQVAKTNGNGNKIGPSVVLKVMAGDKFNLRCNSWYKTNGVTPGAPQSPLTDLLASLISGVSSAAAATHGGAIASELQSSGILNPAATQFLNSQSYNGSKPKAFVNWILLDEQFKYVTGSGDAVGSNEEFKTHLINDIAITKSGYLYIYVSNETPNIDVFFDNLQVTHVRGPMLEETHYYPFGLTMSGISSKAAGSLDNDMKFNGKELNEDLDLDWYEYGFRNNFDPQLGRFHSVDPLASDYPYYTPYQFAGNQVPNAIDIDGLEPAFFNDLLNWAVQKVATNPNSNTSKAIGAVVGAGKSIEKTVTGVGNVIAHPINTLQGIASLNTPEGIANMAISVSGKVNAYQNGTGFEKSAIISEAVTDVATAVVGTKGIGAGVKGAEAAGEVAGVVKTASPNVQKVLNTLNEIKAEGGTVKLNRLDATQEINMTIQKGSSKLDVRVETHVVPEKYGGNGVTPQRHMNVDLYPKNKNPLPNKGHKILE